MKPLKNSTLIYATRSFVLLILALLLGSCLRKDMSFPDIGALAPSDEEALRKADVENPWRLYEKPFGAVTTLNGTWQIAAGSMDDMPEAFHAEVQVPGLVTLAEPAFQEVGFSGKYEAFWYRRTFETASRPGETTYLKVYKAKYGTQVFVNGREAGYQTLNFTPSLFDISSMLHPRGEENELVIRIGAHIDALPDTVCTGGEIEKKRYMPGIYDNVELIRMNGINIRNVQVVPELLNNRVRVQLEVNFLGGVEECRIQGKVSTYHDGEVVGHSNILNIRKGSGKSELTIPVPDARPWTPEDPFLYVVRITDGTFSYQTRFGMRSFRLDSTRTNLALLNEDPYYFRGTNVALFRFFEDPECADLPWNRAWVRSLFRKYKALGLNSVRTCISSFPKFWYELADEEGLALFAEYPMWYAFNEEVSSGDFTLFRKDPVCKYGIYPEKLTTPRLVNEYARWMKDLWNHASVIAWDAQNETWSIHTGEAIQVVRKLDLSNRPWDNGWSPPASKSDWREGHSYFAGFNPGKSNNQNLEARAPFSLGDLTKKVKIPRTFYMPYQNAYNLPRNDYTEQPCLLNEYGYLWLNRDGTPTSLTKAYYDALFGPDCDPDTRREHYAYMLAAITEYWRSSRACFGINYPFGLAHSLPYGATSDNLIDVKGPEFDPNFEETMIHAFAPVGICIEEWDETFPANSINDLPVVVTNDLDKRVSGRVTVSIIQDNRTVSSTTLSVDVPAWEQKRTYFRVNYPGEEGAYSTVATLEYEGNEVNSVRKISIIRP
jgi:hypothetical protein